MKPERLLTGGAGDAHLRSTVFIAAQRMVPGLDETRRSLSKAPQPTAHHSPTL